MSHSLTRRRTLCATGAVLAIGAIAGCSDDGGGTERPDFGIEEFVFTAGQATAYDEYERQPDAVYEPGSVVWLYVDVVGFDVEDAGEGQFFVDIAEDLIVRDPDGAEILEDDFDFEDSYDEEFRDQFFVVNNVTMPSTADTGEYEVEVRLEDELAGTSTTATDSFSLE